MRKYTGKIIVAIVGKNSDKKRKKLMEELDKVSDISSDSLKIKIIHTTDGKIVIKGDKETLPRCRGIVKKLKLSYNLCFQ